MRPASMRKAARRALRPRPGRSPASPRSFFLARRPPAPKYWRNIAPELRAAPRGKPMPEAERQRRWQLVLQAKGIRYRFFERGKLPSLYVPPVAAKAALHEILAFERERPFPPLPRPRQRKGLYWHAVLLALLLPWHRIRWDGLLPQFFPFATARDWLTTAGLDAYRVSVSGEWWRAVTSLTLHADAAHLISNLAMGIVFGIPLCRHTGVGFGFFLTLAAGACGNIVTAFIRPASFLSQGASTAIFASVGLLAAFAAVFAGKHAAAHTPEDFSGQISVRRRKAALKQGVLKALVPIGAGLGILAMLGGSEAPGVDYLAHSMGLACGMGIGLAVALLMPRLLTLRSAKNTALQTLSLAASAVLLVLCWHMALR